MDMEDLVKNAVREMALTKKGHEAASRIYETIREGGEHSDQWQQAFNEIVDVFNRYTMNVGTSMAVLAAHLAQDILNGDGENLDEDQIDFRTETVCQLVRGLVQVELEGRRTAGDAVH